MRSDSASGKRAFPTVVAHCDWSINPRKRWMAVAVLGRGEQYTLQAPYQVSEPENLLASLRSLAFGASSVTGVLVGFDFPIGLPIAYAKKTRISDFLSILPILGQGVWSSFFKPAALPNEISLERPFYPLKTGQARLVHLLDGLGLENRDELLRVCERGHATRRAACPLFWTMGGQQVGKAALNGWKEILQPTLPDAAIWPFSGEFHHLLQQGGVVIAETYPAEFYAHLGITFPRAGKGGKSGKRVREDRAANYACLLNWAGSAGILLEETLTTEMREGFGSSASGEDRFDAVVGLCGMLNVVLGFRSPGDPTGEETRRIEGWILGQS